MEKKPKLIVITGRPGSGKTTLSRELGRDLHYPVISRDELKEGYVNTFRVKHDKLPDDTNAVVTQIFFKNIEFLLQSKISLIAEAAFQHKVWEPAVNNMSSYADVYLIICEVDAEVAAERHLKRGLEDSQRELFHGDNRVTHYKNTGVVLPAGDYEPPAFDLPTIKVSTTDGYSPSLSEIGEIIR